MLDQNDIKDRFERGCQPWQIALELGVPITEVEALSPVPLEKDWRYYRAIKKGGAATCYACGRVFPRGDFPRTPNFYSCVKCGVVKKPKREYSLEQRFARLIKMGIDRAERKGYRFEIDVADLQRLWDRQEGLCYLSGDPIGLQPGRPECLTIGLQNPSKGFVKGNVFLSRRDAEKERNAEVSEVIARFVSDNRNKPKERARPIYED